MELRHRRGAIGSLAGALGLALLMAACGAQSPTQPTPLAPVTTALSGSVFEVVPGGRIPAPGIPLIAVIATPTSCERPCIGGTTFTRVPTTTGADGRYQLAGLPSGSAIILPDTFQTHRLVCGAAVDLGPAARLDVEITSSANPQPSPTNPPLRITGHTYEVTSTGQVPVDGVLISLDWKAADSPFVSFVSDGNGGYAMCGIPRNTLVLFQMWKPGYEDTSFWSTFSSDRTIDIEMERRQ